MTHVCGYHCPCAGRYDQRNTVRGGSTRSAWPASPTVRAVVLPPICQALKDAKLKADASDAAQADLAMAEKRAKLQAEREALMHADAMNTAPTMPASIRQMVRYVLRRNRPGAWSEIRRAVSEWWHTEIKTNRDAIETMAAVFCMVAACAAIVAPLFRMAMGVAR